MISFMYFFLYATFFGVGISFFRYELPVHPVASVFFIVLGIVGMILTIMDIIEKLEKKIPDNKKCSECKYADCIIDPFLMAGGYVCKKNPFKPMFMGWNGKHSDRKKDKRAK